MKPFRDLALSLAAIVLLIITAVNIDVQRLVIGGAAATPTPTAAPQAARAAAEAIPTPTLRVQPDSLTLRGHRTGVSSWLGRIGPWDLTPAASIPPVPLTVWQVDKDKTIQPGEYQLTWSPLSGQGWHGDLTIKQQPEETCRRVAATTAPAAPLCYSVSVDQAQPAPTGVYSTTLYVSNQKGAETAVAVRLKVGRSIWWPVAMVILGILTTEFLVHWGKQRYHQLWHTRRGDWIDLIADSTGWATVLATKDAAVYPALHAVRAALRTEIKKLADWLDGATQGKTTIADLPATPDQTADRLHSLRVACAAYLKDGPPGQIEDLRSALLVLSEQATMESAQHWQMTQAEAKAMYDAASALKPAWQAITAPDDPALLGVWSTLRDMWKRLEELADGYNLIKTAGTGVAVAGPTLKTNLEEMQSKVLSAAGQQSAALAAVTDSTAKTQIATHLAELAKLGLPREGAQTALTKALQPLKYCQPAGGLDRAHQRCAQLVRSLDQRFAALAAPDLAPTALEDLMLRPLKDKLSEAERLASEKDIADAWPGIGKKYEESRRLVRTGRYLEDLYRRNQESVQSAEVDRRLETAYRLLLNRDALAAQIELERAERIFLAGNPLAKRVVRLVAEVIRPVLAALSALVWLVAAPVADLLGKVGWAPMLGPGGPSVEPRPQPLAQGGGASTGRQAAPSVVKAVLALAAVIVLFWLIYWTPRSGVTIMGKEPSWFVAAIGAVLLAIGLLCLLVIVLRYAVLWLRLVREHTWPNVQLAVLTTASLALTIIVAAAVVIVANNLANTLETWGTAFDFVAAFTWGAVAGQSAKPLQSALQKALAAAKSETPA